MKNQIIVLLSLLILVIFLSGCASAPKEKIYTSEKGTKLTISPIYGEENQADGAKITVKGVVNLRLESGIANPGMANFILSGMKLDTPMNMIRMMNSSVLITSFDSRSYDNGLYVFATSVGSDTESDNIENIQLLIQN